MTAGVRGKSRKTSPILGVDGQPVGHDPTILLPGGAPEPRPPALHLGVAPDGVVIAIRNGTMGIEAGDTVVSTNMPWQAMPSLINNLVKLMAFHYPRETEEEETVEEGEILDAELVPQA
jgi:hypothetical protein